MAKIVLGNPPKTIKKAIKVQLLDGSDGEVGFLFKYRTRTEYGAWIDSLMSGDEPIGGEVLKMPWEKLAGKTVEANASYIMQAADGWDLDIEFNPENVKQFCNEFPLACSTAMDTYRQAINEGRMGN